MMHDEGGLSEIAAELVILTRQLSARITDPAEPPLIAAARQYARGRERRPDLFSDNDSSDPAWDILLHLAIAAHDGRDVSISAAANASLVPPTTGLRWISRLIDAGLTIRERDQRDGRRVHLRLTELGAAMARRAMLTLVAGH